MGDEPAYVAYWLGKRVTWRDRQRDLAGVVTRVDRHKEYDVFVTRITVARDDGFLSPGLDVTQILTVDDAPSKEFVPGIPAR